MAVRPQICRLLVEDPEFGARIPAELQDQAISEVVAGVVRLRRGEWNGTIPDSDGGVGALVLDGLLLRRVGIDARFGAELLGEGDLIKPWAPEGVVAGEARWRVLRPVRLALLDAAATRRLSRYPELVEELVNRALARTRGLASNMAIAQQPGVDVRLQHLLWLLADRWGKVTPDGIRLPLNLTHAVLGEMVGARRPTVTTALSELARRDRVIPLEDGGWELHGDPPAGVGELRSLGVAATWVAARAS